MAPSRRVVLLGPPERRFERRLALLFAAGLFVATFLAYAVDLFAVAGGVVFLAGDAAAVGVVSAAVLGYQRNGLAFGWLAAFAALLGASADHYLLGLPGRSIPSRVEAFLSPDGLVFLAVAAVVLGSLAWSAGVAGSVAVAAVRERTS